MGADAARVMARCDALDAFSEEPGRLTRRFATAALGAAMDEVAGWMAEAGLAVRRDAVGNLVGRLEGGGPRTLLLGSHLDSVRDAGSYDGPLGVLVALAAVERLGREGDGLPFAIEVLAFADEEGVRYGTAYLGSSVLSGRFDPAWLERVDDDGVSMGEAVRLAGGDPDRIPAERREDGSLVGWLEVHIEQGPVLEDRGLPVGVVSTIQGSTRLAVTLEGMAGHAGTVPMGGRRDALAAAAELVLAVEAEAKGRDGLVATVGTLTVEPGASNVIPGRVELSIDLRHPLDAEREAALDALRGRAGEIATARGVALGWEIVMEKSSTPCSAELSGVLAEAVAATGHEVLRLPSGAGHDAVALAPACPTAMLFVRCAGGVSHHPDESVSEDDVAVAVDVVVDAVRRLARAARG